MKQNTMFGIQAARYGFRFPFVEKIVENLSVNIKTAQISIPYAICKPLPPLIFLDAKIAPIIVSISTATGVAVR
jgi:hypothetical protein